MKKNKILEGNALYTVIAIIIGFLVGAIVVGCGGLSPAAAIHGGIWVITLTTAVCGAILYAITMRMLNRHLNLE